ncbi:MAG TPA: cysteine desulfurase-like protein [Pseudonocardiaceae bacterium]|nr:cysteine desulfurase-like protein [Pseudonocardiaceae bacterium]
MGYDVDALRARFPALASGTAHFDGPGGSQVPDVVADAVHATLVSSIANRGRVTAAERRADDVVRAARSAMADLLRADERGIVFGRSMTQLTYDFARTLAKTWRPGDNVVVTRLDHDANIRPWVQAATAVGAAVRWAEFDPSTAELTVADVATVLDERTRLVAVTGAANLIGTRPPIAEIAELAHEAGALCYVDGVHLTAHAAVEATPFDFFACSPYKFLGPHCGVLAGKPDVLADLHPDKLLPATEEIPDRFEFGTLPYELLAGTTAAVDLIASLGTGADRRARIVAGMTSVAEHEDRLRHRVEAHLAELPGAVCHSRAKDRTPTLLVTFAGQSTSDAHRFLAERNINAPAGSFYAVEASRRLGLGDTGGLRIGIAPYTDDAEIDRLIAGLTEFVGAAS